MMRRQEQEANQCQECYEDYAYYDGDEDEDANYPGDCDECDYEETSSLSWRSMNRDVQDMELEHYTGRKYSPKQSGSNQLCLYKPKSASSFSESDFPLPEEQSIKLTARVGPPCKKPPSPNGRCSPTGSRSAVKHHRTASFKHRATQEPMCRLDPYAANKADGLFGWLLKRFQAPSSHECPLKADFSRSGRSLSINRKRSREDEHFEQLDELLNPQTFTRWKSIEHWDQHKETLWRQLIQGKLDCPPNPNSRGIAVMIDDALKALNSPDGECVAFRMFYGILKRNEDLYLTPFISSFTDSQFLRLIVALNRFYAEDPDKRKTFFDHSPASSIEKIMMKETLGIIDPESKLDVVARRFWNLFLDWYAEKVSAATQSTIH